MEIKLVYIAGSNRSGTTVLGNTLGQLNQFAHVGETYLIWRRGFIENWLCGCGEEFKKCPFWVKVQKEILSKYPIVLVYTLGDLLSKYPRVYRVPEILTKIRKPLQGKTYEDYKKILRDLYYAIWEASGGKIIIDSSKTFIYLYTIHEIKELDIYIVHLVRDPRGVAYSHKRKKPMPTKKGEISYMWRASPQVVAFNYLITNSAIEFFGRNKKYMRIRYEDFVVEPIKTLKEITEFVGVKTKDFDFVKGQEVLMTPSHTVSGNPSRFDKGNVKLVLDNEWIHRLNKFEKLLVNTVNFPLLWRYRYF